MPRRKVERVYPWVEDALVMAHEDDDAALDSIFRDFNPMDLLAANIEAGLSRDELGKKERP